MPSTSSSSMPNSIPDSLASVDLSVSGRLDASATIFLRDTAACAVQDGPVLVLLDVTEITNINASGVVGLLEVLHLIRSRGGDLRVFGSSEVMRDVLSHADLMGILRIYRSRVHAIDGGAGRASHALQRNGGVSGRFTQRMRALARI